MTKDDFFRQIDASWRNKMGVSIVKQAPPALFNENVKQRNRREESSLFFPNKSRADAFCVCFLDFDSVNSVETYIHDMLR